MRLTLVAILALIVGVFIVQNTEVTEVRFLLWSLSMSRALMFLLILAIGVALGWLWHAHATHRRQSPSSPADS